MVAFPWSNSPWTGEATLDLDRLRGELAANARATSLVSVQWVNNEVGTVQPITDVVALAADAGVAVHSDAAQAVAYEAVNFDSSGLATMAVSAHKVGGPVGVGALVARRDAALVPLTHGGGQGRKVRSGTLDVPGAAAFAAALEESVASRDVEACADSCARGSACLWRADLSCAQRAERTRGGLLVRPRGRPTSCTSLFRERMRTRSSLASTLAAIDASQGSACTAGVVQASHVLLAMGRSEADATSTLRFSLGWTSTEADVDAVIAAIPEVVERASR